MRTAWRAEVPELKARTYFLPMYPASRYSNSSMIGPMAQNIPLLMVSCTILISSSSQEILKRGIFQLIVALLQV
jgi:hypothetical protein